MNDFTNWENVMIMSVKRSFLIFFSLYWFLSFFFFFCLFGTHLSSERVPYVRATGMGRGRKKTQREKFDFFFSFSFSFLFFSVHISFGCRHDFYHIFPLENGFSSRLLLIFIFSYYDDIHFVLALSLSHVLRPESFYMIYYNLF